MWEDILSLLPFEIANHIRMITEELTEIRIRRDGPVCVCILHTEGERFCFENRELGISVDGEMLDEIMRSFTENSFYAYENTLKDGYIAVKGCYRVGVVGKVICDGDRVVGLQSIHSLNIRLWRHLEGIADDIYRYIKGENFRKSFLIFSPPNYAKTSVLRDLAISLTRGYPHKKVALIDSRSEIATPEMRNLAHLDILSDYPKAKGIEIATRVLSPDYILCDEVGLSGESAGLDLALNCGIPCIMTVHASSREALMSHPTVRDWDEKGIFDVYVSIDRLLSDGRAEFSFYTRETV